MFWQKFGILLCLVAGALSHSYHLGKTCPVVEPMQGFEMSKFLGIWYAIEKTSTASNCLIYNITRGEEPGHYVIEQDSQHFALGLTPLQHEYRYTGELNAEDPSIPARMTVKFPLNVAGRAQFTVFSTDYDQYAGIFSCQTLAIAHRQSATILSRTKALDRIYLDKLHTKLTSFGVSPFDLSTVSQTKCPPTDEGVDINIDKDTFSAKSVANVLRKAGEKIGDGAEAAWDATKKAYGTLTGAEQEATPAPPKKTERVVEEKDAEWLP